MIRITQAAAAAVFALALVAGGPAAAGEAEDSAALTRLATASGVTYKTTKSPTVITIDYTGKKVASIKVIAAAQDDLIVIFTNPIKKAALSVSNAALMRMARLNHELDYVKVGIDDDGDLFVRADIPIGSTPAQFKEITRQVAASTDEVYEAISAFPR